MSCTPKCPYFPKTDSVEYVVDEYGVKKTSYKFVCGYDALVIRGWDKECPRKKVKK